MSKHQIGNRMEIEESDDLIWTYQRILFVDIDFCLAIIHPVGSVYLVQPPASEPYLELIIESQRHFPRDARESKQLQRLPTIAREGLVHYPQRHWSIVPPDVPLPKSHLNEST